ncbi:hypothetical protein [Qiania dongpingensis]|uniref:Uncharacterized protein n=1 Tax=Qiania dongpingensis TaxID=2763669 RepID=A0A7G9G5J5_9FIRM|nr:hypothetical protein [Qiania dongpingensis]QNM06077.1 hypothetical protein H9Q78_02630 [Qiania dongpingensis]
MPRGKKNYTLDEKIEAAQKLILSKERELNDIKRQLEILLEEKEKEDLNKLNRELKKSGRTIEELLRALETGFSAPPDCTSE